MEIDIGEIVYRGEVHRGEHAPILDRELFDAVQAKLAERAIARKLTRSRSPSILASLVLVRLLFLAPQLALVAISELLALAGCWCPSSLVTHGHEFDATV
jgi:membrane-associated PAP2 superfamily phosphatase